MYDLVQLSTYCNWLRAGRLAFDSLKGMKIFSPVLNLYIGSVIHTATYTTYIEGTSLRQDGWIVKLSFQLQTVTR
jgi:hypothetical protein